MDILGRRLSPELLAMVLVAAVATSAAAQISPGELSQPHASLEGTANCLKCHELGKGPNAAKCLACHREIAAGISERRGYHFRATGGGEQPCFGCHSEHVGRDFQLIHWPKGVENFDHQDAGYRLQGKHAQLECRECHKKEFIREDLARFGDSMNRGRTFLGLRAECLACHADEHRGQLPGNCSQCHTEDAWKPATAFDHQKTVFPLTGKHRALACVKCHAVVETEDVVPAKREAFVRYTGLSFADCASCHRDVHDGGYGAACKNCHNTAGWRDVTAGKFDHSRTRFPLLGRHVGISCDKCHRAGAKKAPLPHERCSDCHEDVHRGQFAARAGGACESCHTVDGFVPSTFTAADHATTRFALSGAHRTQPCAACHPLPRNGGGAEYRVFKIEDSGCDACHRDVHRGQFAARAGGGCESCHTVERFAPAMFTVADHAKTRFVLEGAHLAQPCVACHPVSSDSSGAKQRVFKIEDTRCESCHTDIHFGQFSRSRPAKDCAACHSAAAWRPVSFDHDRDSTYKLEGRHREVNCGGCHVRVTVDGSTFVRYKPIDPACVTCHQGTGGEGFESKVD